MRMTTMPSGTQPQPQIPPAREISRQLTGEQRAELGLVLACSFLQLCKDAWGAKLKGNHENDDDAKWHPATAPDTSGKRNLAPAYGRAESRARPSARLQFPAAL